MHYVGSKPWQSTQDDQTYYGAHQLVSASPHAPHAPQYTPDCTPIQDGHATLCAATLGRPHDVHTTCAYYSSSRWCCTPLLYDARAQWKNVHARYGSRCATSGVWRDPRLSFATLPHPAALDGRVRLTNWGQVPRACSQVSWWQCEAFYEASTTLFRGCVVDGRRCVTGSAIGVPPSAPAPPSPPSPPAIPPVYIRWVAHLGTNCYEGHGATDLLNMGVVADLDACKAKCLEVRGCEGIVTRIGTGGDDSPPACHARGSIELHRCGRPSLWDLHLIEHAPAPLPPRPPAYPAPLSPPPLPPDAPHTNFELLPAELLADIPSIEGMLENDDLAAILSRFKRPDGSPARSVAVVGSSGVLHLD